MTSALPASASSGAMAASVVPMSTSGLEVKLRELKNQSNKHSQALTQKLASSQSGQDLLHIGTSLQSLPSDLHAMLQQLHSVVSSAESAETKFLQQLKDVVQTGMDIRQEQRRIAQAMECAQLYRDIQAGESILQLEASRRRSNMPFGGFQVPAGSANGSKPFSMGGDLSNTIATVEHVASLERCAHIVLAATQELQVYTKPAMSKMNFPKIGDATGLQHRSTSGGSAPSSIPSLKAHLDEDPERAHFLMKLAPRIRRLESGAAIALTHRFEEALKILQRQGQDRENEQGQEQPAIQSQTSNREQTPGGTDGLNDAEASATPSPPSSSPPQQPADSETAINHQRQMLYSLLLIVIGQCMRGLTLLGRAKDVENSFARVAIMPLIRSKMYMGRLDEGGPRGECAGLLSLLEELTQSISNTFGGVLELAESIFKIAADVDTISDGGKEDSLAPPLPIPMEVDLITEGVWVPIVTALMSDAGIKMAIFAPGIAKILQRNYVTLDNFLAGLAASLLISNASSVPAKEGAAPASNGGTDPTDPSTSTALVGADSTEQASLAESLLQATPKLSIASIKEAQRRIFSHVKTEEFSKRWNLPIYYQLRFGDCCNRLNAAIEGTTRGGWSAMVFAGTSVEAEPSTTGKVNASVHKFSLSLFREAYDILMAFWRQDVVLRPLTHRFLRGSVQLIGRLLAFIEDGLEGKVLFGEEVSNDSNGVNGKDANAASTQYPNMTSYSWGKSELDIACVTWELSVLESMLQQNLVPMICSVLTTDGKDTRRTSDAEDLQDAISAFMADACQNIQPIVAKGWDEKIVDVMIEKCKGPLAAVKGVAATYRMTRRPPPDRASHFVSTILRPLKEFSAEFVNRTPPSVTGQWKTSIVATISNEYANATRDLLETVQKTEAALQSRRARRAAAGGISDGDKVKLQLYLDYKEFLNAVNDVGVDPANCEGINRLRALTEEGASLMTENK